jgi:exopolysaccharide biosynthesis protein
MTEANTAMDKSYQTYLATLPPPQTTSAEGYSYQTVKTDKGTFGVYLIKVPLSSVRVKTVAAISSDCKNNCDTKSLAQYVQENNGFAGMNGSYICPPDYSSCAGKTNSFDYAFFASNHDKWLNKKALTWFKTGMFTFSGNSYSFYKKTSEYGGGGVDAAISNYPSLLKNGEIVVNDSELTAYQRLKGMKGAIGVGGENLYLALMSNVTMEEAAYVMKALGVKHALNLDGGGTSAMYINGKYVVGPGRSLPNAIVLVK